MEKKYQFFISSTYEDLKEERNKAIQAILTMNQFPIGMEMFSAADDDQWKIIKEAIDSSDFYILIIGNKYGSIEETTGISYTEKEFDYAVERKIPVLAFIVDSYVSMTADKFETDSQKISKLNGKFDQLAKCAIFCAEGGLISANPARRYGEYGYQEFLDEMLSLGGIDKRLLLNEKALKSHLHIIKKDFDILAQFKYDGGIIEQDITVIYSEHDSTCINMDEWGKITVGNISYKTLGDNHFFLNQCYKEMADIINNQLKEWIY
ncbi:MAG: DUF4062 domain-containing protein [Lachnospiraceae bacterium]|nr:DUF4062 domain-containing protein [Lachnospiraceae bacterium]